MTPRAGPGRGRLVVAAFLLAASAPVPSTAAEARPPIRSVEEGRARLEWLRGEAERVEEWVEGNWEAELARRRPDISRGPIAPGESERGHREREMRARMAVSALKAALRSERKGWIEKERQALLDREIPDVLPVRLGAYDTDRGEFPVLLGYGWPAGLIVKARVGEREKAAFATGFPNSLPALFRIDDKGNLFLESLDKRLISAELSVFVAPPGPRLLWRGSHESWVTAVAFRPDGSQAVTAGADGALCAWDPEIGNRLWRLENVEMALSLAFHPAGTSFASGGADSVLRLREADTGKLIWEARAKGMIFSASFSPDGRYVATGDDGGHLIVWNAESGKELVRGLLGASVRAVAFTAEGKTIAAGGEGKHVVLWNVLAGRPSWQADFGWPVYAVAAGRDGLVAAGGGGGTIHVLRADDGGEVWSRKSDGEVRAVGFDPSGRLLAFGGAGYAARVLAAGTGEPRWSASVGSPVRSLAFSPSGTRMLVGSADFAVRLFEIEEADRALAAYSSFGRIYVRRDRAARLFR